MTPTGCTLRKVGAQPGAAKRSNAVTKSCRRLTARVASCRVGFWQSVPVPNLPAPPALPAHWTRTGQAAPARAEWQRLAFERLTRTFFRRYLTTEVTGRDRLPDGAMLICSNHASHLDSAALMIAAGRPFDDFRLLAAADYFTPASFAGRLTRALLHIVAIDRASGHATRLRQTVTACRDEAEENRVSFIAFPEGTRSTTGRLLPFKRGAAFLAVELGVPVVPAFVDGTALALPKGRWLPQRARIHVRFGRPMLPEEWSGRRSGPAGPAAYVAGELERRVRALAEEKLSSAEAQ